MHLIEQDRGVFSPARNKAAFFIVILSQDERAMAKQPAKIIRVRLTVRIISRFDNNNEYCSKHLLIGHLFRKCIEILPGYVAMRICLRHRVYLRNVE